MVKTIILSKADYVLLSTYIKNHSAAFSQYSLKKLAVELQSAKIVEEDKLPKDVVRLNSEVRIVDVEQKKDMTLKLVLPSEANVKENKISIVAPLSTALIGYSKGDIIEWEVPSGTKRFKILEVNN
ncbi:MAG TPA: GreA/GreB family elongation factor [Cytophagaceae bacterium]